MLRPAALAVALLLAAASPGASAAAAQDAPKPEAQQPSAPQNEAPKVLAIQVVGQKRYTEQQIRDAIGQKVGEKLDRDLVDRGLTTLVEVFKVRGTVKLRPVEGGVELRIEVVELKVDPEPRFLGNVEIDVEMLRKWAQLGDRSELYLYQAPRIAQRILEGYRREGYYFAEVEIVKRGDEGDKDAGAIPDVIFEIREGPQVHVKDVIVQGNDSLPETGLWFWKSGLKSLARTDLDGPWLFNWKGSKFDTNILEADLLAMREVYRDLGFLDAVVERGPLEFSPDRTGVVIHVIVDEGKTYTVSKIGIVGVDRVDDPKDPTAKPVETPVELLFPEADLLKLCSLKPGVTYKRATQRTDERALRDYYGERGYVAHSELRLDSWEFLDPETRFDTKTHQVEVTYRLAQGKKLRIREVMFAGGENTRDRVLRREIDVLPGETANIKKINDSLRRLTYTNYFSDEFDPLQHKDPVYRFVPAADPEHPDLYDIEYQVQEGRVVNFQVFGGVDSNTGLFGRVTLRMQNFDATNLPSSVWDTFGEIYDKEAFHGAGQLLDLSVSPGTQVNSYRIRFVEPDIFQRHFDRYSLDLKLERTDSVYDLYHEDRLDRRVLIGREFGRKWTVFGGYTNQILDITDIDAPLTGVIDPLVSPVPPTLLAEAGTSDLIGGVLNVTYRDIDRPVNPTQGVRATWRNTVYGGAFGGDWDFVKSDLDVDSFFPVGSPEEDVRPGFRLVGGLGIAVPYGDTQDVPYSERFFLGGSTQLRGFEYRGVGPSIQGNALGGETSLNASIEYHIPLYRMTQPGTYKEIEVFRLTFFTDAGILDPDPFQLDPQELRASVGFGFGLVYPIPLTLNFGFPIKSDDGDRKQTFSYRLISIGF